MLVISECSLACDEPYGFPRDGIDGKLWNFFCESFVNDSRHILFLGFTRTWTFLNIHFLEGGCFCVSPPPALMAHPYSLENPSYPCDAWIYVCALSLGMARSPSLTSVSLHAFLSLIVRMLQLLKLGLSSLRHSGSAVLSRACITKQEEERKEGGMRMKEDNMDLLEMRDAAQTGWRACLDALRRGAKNVPTSSLLTVSPTHTLSLSLCPWLAFVSSIITTTGLISLIVPLTRSVAFRFFLHWIYEQFEDFYGTMSWIFHSALCADCVLVRVSVHLGFR